MIGLIKGNIITRTPEEILVDVSGVGYCIHIPSRSLESIPTEGDSVILYIHTHVREDALSLYGFLTREEKELFVKLLRVNGVGPKLALTIISGLPAGELIDAVCNEDLATLNSISGVGKKTAERIIIDLKDKLLTMNSQDTAKMSAPKKPTLYNDACSALLNLGYNKLHIEKALSKVQVNNQSSIGMVIKSALRELSSL